MYLDLQSNRLKSTTQPAKHIGCRNSWCDHVANEEPSMRKSGQRKALPGTASPRFPLGVFVMVVGVAVIPALAGQRDGRDREMALIQET